MSGSYLIIYLGGLTSYCWDSSWLVVKWRAMILAMFINRHSYECIMTLPYLGSANLRLWSFVAIVIMVVISVIGAPYTCSQTLCNQLQFGAYFMPLPLWNYNRPRIKFFYASFAQGLRQTSHIYQASHCHIPRLVGFVEDRPFSFWFTTTVTPTQCLSYYTLCGSFWWLVLPL